MAILDHRGREIEAFIASVEAGGEPDADATADAQRLMAILGDVIADEVNLRFSLEDQAVVGQGGGYLGLGAASDLYPYRGTREELIRACRQAYFRNPIARNAVEALRLFVVGAGCSVRPVDQDAETTDWLTEWEEREKMPHRISEMVRRTLRDGETYIRLMPEWEDGPDHGFTKVRMLEPLRIVPDFAPDDPRPATLAMQSGIVTNPLDIEDVWYYCFDTNGDMRGDIRIPAEQITHIKLYADGDMLHGRPLLEPVLKRLSQYDQWVEQRAILNRLKTAVYLIRKVRGTAGAVSALVGQTLMSSRPNRTAFAKLPPPGTMLTATDNIDYEFTEPKLDAKDVSEDGRKIILDVAAGLGMPIPLLTGDVSETTYAGLLVAESPFVRRAQDLQQFFTVPVAKIYSEAIKSAIEAGELPRESSQTIMTEAAKMEMEHWEKEIRDSRGDDRRSGRARGNLMRVRSATSSYAKIKADRRNKVQVTWPEVLSRDVEKLMKALQIMANLGIASKSTLAVMAGLDYDKERERMAAEQTPDSMDQLEDIEDVISGAALQAVAGATPEVPESKAVTPLGGEGQA